MKKQIALALALMVALATVGCGAQPPSSVAPPASTPAASSGSGSSTAASSTLENGITNPTGYPITNEKITLEGAIIYGAHKGDFEKYDYWNVLAEKTGIQVKLRVLSAQENVNLMFASRDYPDFAFSTDVPAQQFSEAAEAGDIVKLNDYMADYAPNYSAFFNENPDMKALCLESDGGLYSLPFVSLAEWDYNMRDCFFVNSNWLKELNLTVPTTLDEFTNYLRQVKANAGKGSIPKDVAPYYFRHQQRIGGPFEIFASFGLLNGTINGLGEFLQDGKVVTNAINPKIKEPLKYLRMLYQEGLIPPEVFTDDNGAYTAKLKAVPAVVGAISSYGHNNIEHWEYMPLLETNTGAKPMLRFQQKAVSSRKFVIFKDNPNPIATLRLGDLMGDTEWSVYSNWGAEGAGYKKEANGEFRKLQDVGLQPDQTQWVPGNYANAILTEETNKQLNTEVIKDPRGREYAYYNIYSKFLPPANISVFPRIPSGYRNQEDSDKLTQITTDTDSYISKTFANWITGKTDIDAEWDGYLKKLNDMGMQQRIDIHQKTYDAFKADQK